MSSNSEPPNGDEPGGSDPLNMGIDAFNRFMQVSLEESRIDKDEDGYGTGEPGSHVWRAAAQIHAGFAIALELRKANHLREIELQILDRNTPGPKLWTPGAGR